MKSKLIFFATSWSGESGGINAINYDLGRSLDKSAVDIFVIVPNAMPAETAEAAERCIKIVSLNGSFDALNKNISSIAKEIALDDATSLYWIGHDAITGGAAIYAKNFFGGRSVVFHHMDYANYYYLKHNAVAAKISIQKTLLKTADVVFAVGPRLFRNAKHLRNAHQETYLFIPGAPQAEPSKRAFDHRVAICGRLHVSEDLVKNLSAGVKGAYKALAQISTGTGSISLIGTLGSDLNKLNLSGGSKAVAINEFPYVTSRDLYFRELLDVDVLIMPSVKEGFGLVAFEAACLGIPILVSKSSGFYEYGLSSGWAEKISTVEIMGIAGVDEAAIAAALTHCFSDFEQRKKDALELADILRVSQWSDVAYKFQNLIESSDAKPPLESLAKEAVQNLPQKQSERSKSLSIDKDVQYGNFERFEDLLSLTSRKRELVVPKSRTTDFSKGRKVKFEFWRTESPQIGYFLYIAPGANIGQTVKSFAAVLADLKDKPREVFLLRRDKSEANYIQKLFDQEQLKIRVQEFTLKEYVWEYGIDRAYKIQTTADSPANYIDQSLEESTQGGAKVHPAARTFLLEKILGKPTCAAHLVVATGGMGKTWLCRSLVNEVSRQVADKKLIVLIQAESLRNYFLDVGYAHIQVNSVFDLYEIHGKSIRDEQPYDKFTFELAVLSGNVIVIVDGLDELATVLQERFNLAQFLGSIKELSSSLRSSQVLLTTRDNLLLEASQIEEFGIEKYSLLGFSSKDWSLYAGKRFNLHPSKISLRQKLDKVLSDSDLVGPEGRVIPFLVDVVCNILEEEEKDKSNADFELSGDATPYFSNNELTDRVVHSIFRREVRRQNIDLSVDELVSLLAEIISENGEQFDPSVLSHQLDLYFEARSAALFKKITLNPLFVLTPKNLGLRYGFLQSHFRSLFIIRCLSAGACSSEAMNALAKSNSIESPEVAYVKKYYSSRISELDAALSGILTKIRGVAKDGSDPKRQELARRAISGLLKIYCATRSFTGSKMTEKIIEFLSGPTSHRSIDGLSIYGDFPPLDLTDVVVMNSKFLDYKNFSRSRFKGAKFIFCEFEVCADDGYVDDSISLAEFDASCSLGDIDKLIETAKSKNSISRKHVEDDCLTFLRSFFSNGSRYDPKKSWIKFSNRVPGLRAGAFEKLMPDYIGIKSKKSDNTYYSVSENFSSSVRNFIDNNYMDDKMRKFIEFVG